ncbi:MAG: hypothetical protein H6737_23585 [Alphaproteobacteria bacterium]|nr:hypothetical protein [Alphaproteobacteria bacterium]
MSLLFSLGALAAEPASPHPEMHSFLLLARGARDATIRGDLDASRKQMQSLTEVFSFEEFPEAGKPFLIGMKSAATDGAKAKSLDDAGHALGRIASACGECHAALGAGPDFGAVGKPPKGDDLNKHMQLHDWAATRMWEGLVVSDAKRWEAGATALFAESWVHPDTEDDAKTATFGHRVHETGLAAMLTWSDAQRAALYGQFVANCAGCHRGRE